MTSFLHLWQGLLLGCGLGLLYGFLRPFRPRWLGDLLFVFFFFRTWIYLMFGLCGGDLRMGYTLALLTGVFLWEGTFGRFLRPLFSSFWKGFAEVFSFLWQPFKNILKKAGNLINFLFCFFSAMHTTIRRRLLA